jgi:Fe2+ or Zn2+ uptake regulation protein
MGIDTSLPQPALGAQRLLRDAGMRVTAPRLAVLGWLADHPHSTADQVTTAVRAQLGTVSTQAVYDVLHAFTDAGLVRRIEPAGHPAQYETRTGDNHHHVVCRSCGRTEDVDCVRGTRPCLHPSDTAGFAVDEAEVVFWGTCPDCLTGRPAGEKDNEHEEDSRP